MQLLSQIIEETSQRQPHKEAFRCRDRSLTYEILNEKSSGLAALLQGHGIGVGDRVAIYMPKAVEMAIGVYGCLKAGAIYVPVDPGLPTPRLASVLRDAGVSAVLTLDRQQKQLMEVLPELDLELQVIVGLPTLNENSIATVPWESLPASSDYQSPSLTENHPAYIIYTSGSTGNPKGILHSHRSGLAYARLAAETYQVNSGDRLGNFAPLHFDQSTFEFFSGPLAGSTTVLIPEEYMRFPASLAKLIDDEQLTIWYSVPFALVQLLLRGALESRDLSSLRWVLFGGEPFPVGHLQKLMKRLSSATFSNVYGPAEVNQCTYFHLSQPPGDDVSSIPIGQIWPETSGMIVDAACQPVPPGELGELLISSPTMMTGYWNRPVLTDAAIVELPQDGEVRKFYRTGDLVRESTDGNLEFHGRSDRQVKIRGNRVELDEIELAILPLSGIEHVAAFATSDPSSDELHVVVFAIVSDDDLLDTSRILLESRKRLPAYAVPSAIVIVDSFPQTTSNKTDYVAMERQYRETVVDDLS
ncbi:amino acid adenylation domain-containing protein [Stieleria varia]|uniref:Linear gramicidin synthase subunit D n=1 Tax=Stieleria varia TaxID=2528005 RepID=A0A5C6AY72_9BACT|nr:amino acid adenylation domain-containing protein [Stieleria varia]TWU04995.1 Linear gramicidin synthase subunit D [Stieleria varia]